MAAPGGTGYRRGPESGAEVRLEAYLCLGLKGVLDRFRQDSGEGQGERACCLWFSDSTPVLAVGARIPFFLPLLMKR